MLPYKKYSFVLLFLLISLVQAALVVERLPVKDKVVALTFDDGPKNGPSEALLELLATYNVKATFFLVGSTAKSDPDLVYRIHKEGHLIANHTYDHVRLDQLSLAQIEQELKTNNDYLQTITKTPIKYFRAPGGRYSDTVYTAAKHNGLKVVNWSLNTADYMMESPLFEKGEAIFVRSKDMIIDYVLKQISPGDIILMHTGNYETIDALKVIIPELQKQGYRFVLISEYV